MLRLLPLCQTLMTVVIFVPQAVDVALARMKTGGFDFSRVAAISGTGQVGSLSPTSLCMHQSTNHKDKEAAMAAVTSGVGHG